MHEGSLRVDRAGDVVWCTLDRPPLNLLEPSLIVALRDSFERLAGDRSVRVAVVIGNGRAFTAGMDLHILRDLDVSGAKQLITDLAQAIAAVHDAPFPVIAALNGHCFGAGLELALACDLRVATTGAGLGLPEVRVGVPSVIHAALLPLMVGPGRAAELLFTGDPVTAEQALEWGLVNRVVAPDQLRETIDELLQRILGCGPSAIRLQKELVVRWRRTDLETAVHVGIDAFAMAYATEEPREGARAFLAKRAPSFRRST